MTQCRLRDATGRSQCTGKPSTMWPLFVIGKRDNVNPPEGAERVREALINGGIEVESCYHDGGHAVPVNDAAAADKIVDWIVDLVNSEPK